MSSLDQEPESTGEQLNNKLEQLQLELLHHTKPIRKDKDRVKSYLALFKKVMTFKVCFYDIDWYSWNCSGLIVVSVTQIKNGFVCQTWYY